MRVEANQLYNVTTFEYQPGIFYEYIGDAKSSNTNWKLITYLDLKEFRYGFETLKNINKEIIRDCENEVTKLMTSFLCQKLFKLHENNNAIPTIESRLKTIESLVGHIFKSREKRGWFDIIGKGLKVVFGTLDQDDADFYVKKIHNFESNEQTLTHIIKDQSVVVQSAIHNFNDTINNLNYNENLMIKNLNSISSVVKKNSETLDFYKKEYLLEEHIIVFEILINQFLQNSNIMIESIFFAKKGLIHPSILDPQQILEHLMKIQMQLPKKLMFPVSLNIENIHLLLNIVDIQCFYQQNFLIFNIIIPLVEIQTFKIHKIIPFPSIYNKEEKLYVFINPSMAYLGLDENKRNYISLTQDQFQDCKLLDVQRFICTLRQPINLIANQENCELNLIQHHSFIPKYCDTRMLHLTNTMFIALSMSNNWIFTTPSTEVLTINCDNVEPFDIKIIGSGSISLHKSCKAFATISVLTPHISFSSEITNVFIPELNLNENCCDELNKKKINLTVVTTNNNYKTINSHIDDLNIASHKLDEISKAADDLIAENNTKTIYRTMSISGIIIALIFISCIAYRCYKIFHRSKCCPGNLCIKVEQRVQTHPQIAPTQNEIIRYQNNDNDQVIFSFSDKNE